MTEFESKIAKGIKPTDEDWNRYLMEVHRQAPSMTPAIFAPYKTSEGLNSYEILAAALEGLTQRAAAVLDLACGDGYLIPLLLKTLGPSATVTGVDMSDGELQVARAKFAHNPQVKLHQARAQELPLPNSSVDAIVSHMAFMLMLPVEPVVAEIHRVLKSGGSFSAVISNRRGNVGFFDEALTLAAPYVERCYPGRKEARTGDVRVQNEAGLKELFSPKTGFDGSLDLFDFSLLIKTGPQGVWSIVSDMYIISTLPLEEKAQLEKDIKSFTAEKLGHGAVEFEFPMRMFSVRKA